MSFGNFSSYQRRVLTLLMLINFVNYVDRQMIFPLFPFLRRDFGLTFFQSGLLATSFTIVLSIVSLPLGMLADRTSRRAVIAGGVLFWSAATFFSGLVRSFRGLLAARALVGVGEAAYTPAGAAIISAAFPKTMRARVQGVFDIGMFVGGAVGMALGGIMGQWFGWRPAFFIVGFPGLLLGLSVFKLREPRRVTPDALFPIVELLRVPAYVMVLVAGWFSAFAGYTYIVWGPELVQTYKGFSASESGVVLGLTSILSGMCGVLVGATVSDKLSQVMLGGRTIVIPIGFIIAAPLIYFAIESHSKMGFVVLFGLGAFFMSWYHGPVTATIHDLISPQGHATALGLYSLFVNLFSMAVAPPLVGRLADRYGLPSALHAAIAAQLVGGILFVVVVWLARRHHAMAAQVADQTEESAAAS
ncbi:MAG TPA: MFS transporter [Terriglobales bacterium]|nr:MFS transporter [Terriglobales bacterium]